MRLEMAEFDFSLFQITGACGPGPAGLHFALALGQLSPLPSPRQARELRVLRICRRRFRDMMTRSYNNHHRSQDNDFHLEES